jgi:hypothetical protein
VPDGAWRAAWSTDPRSHRYEGQTTSFDVKDGDPDLDATSAVQRDMASLGRGIDIANSKFYFNLYDKSN